MNRRPAPIASWLAALLLTQTWALPAVADLAVLVDHAVLVELSPVSDSEDDGPSFLDTSDPINASYVSSGGWAVTGTEFRDAATLSFDFNQTSFVVAATLVLPIETIFPLNGAAPVEVSFFSDNGVIEATDYDTGFVTPIFETNAIGLTELRVSVTGAVNAALQAGRFIGFRVASAIESDSVPDEKIPNYTGIKIFSERAFLEFVPGPAPAPDASSTIFDGFTLEVPFIDVPSVGDVAAQFRLVDPNALTFQLMEAVISPSGGSGPALSGLELFDCSAFEPPTPGGGVAEGIASYSVNSGVLDIPSVNLNNEQVTMRLELIEGSDPPLFETLAIGTVQDSPADSLISALGGSLITEPTLDFVPACHGWALIGDLVRNRVVERNLITGETGEVYPFNTAPDQFTFDAASGLVYMTVHPETERLYQLDLNDGDIVWNLVRQSFDSGLGSHTYGWTLRDLTLGENGNIFALMYDNVLIDPENSIPFTDTGLWLGLMDPNASFLTPSIPLEEPVRVEYDPVQDHVFLATESNLATFDFDPATNSLFFVPGTDLPVGNSCTDFDISPDGNRLAYSCPSGNRPNTNDGDLSIVDMAPDDYFDADGEWFLNSTPQSATFSADGTLLIATDNERLYFFDVVTHLILEDFELGLLEGEFIEKIRMSRDGEILYLLLQNEAHDSNSKFYWMPMPNVVGTPL